MMSILFSYKFSIKNLSRDCLERSILISIICFDLLVLLVIVEQL